MLIAAKVSSVPLDESHRFPQRRETDTFGAWKKKTRLPKRRFLFIRAERGEQWIPYRRFINQRPGQTGRGRGDRSSDVTVNALGRIFVGLVLFAGGSWLSSVASRMFIGLIVAGLVVIARGVYRWADGQE